MTDINLRDIEAAYIPPTEHEEEGVSVFPAADGMGYITLETDSDEGFDIHITQVPELITALCAMLSN